MADADHDRAASDSADDQVYDVSFLSVQALFCILFYVFLTVIPSFLANG